ncbi:hypothetical protein GCM10011348_29310 [Marinobacterium nitratireducens]|uniref:Uncharacterized protein n=1 Tax=Marinobacterium nitratireducens TaxID=518897 RepID=A0A917ZIY6_9GAMM|nr:hypothetical protein GCM10011348_29310 [Marinobacterium nitratireducens]
MKIARQDGFDVQKTTVYENTIIRRKITIDITRRRLISVIGITNCGTILIFMGKEVGIVIPEFTSGKVSY